MNIRNKERLAIKYSFRNNNNNDKKQNEREIERFFGTAYNYINLISI